MESPVISDKMDQGIPLKEYPEVIRFFTAQTSTINRSLALAGVAIIWLFKKPDADHGIVKDVLNCPLYFLAISLSIDLVQYFDACAWWSFYMIKLSRFKHGKLSVEEARNLEAPKIISRTIDLLFAFKIIFMIIAYWRIISYLGTKI